MQFQLTDEQRDIQMAVSEFVRVEFDDDDILDMIQNKRFPTKLIKIAGRTDLIGPHFPEAYGGVDYGLMEKVLIIEGLCRGDSSLGVALGFADVGSELICKYGSEDQREKYLKPLAQGKTIFAAVYPGFDGADENNSVQYLDKDECSGLELNGRCERVHNAMNADYFLVPCVPSSDRHAVIAVVNAKTRGVSVIDGGEKLGLAMMPWGRVVLDNVVADSQDVLGQGQQSDAVFSDVSENIMFRIGAALLGCAQGAFDAALVYSNQREQFGRKINAFQAIRHKLVEMYRRLQAARALLYCAAAAHDNGAVELHDAVAAKLTVEDAALFITDESLQIHGGAGYMIETPIEHFFRDVRVLRAFAGRQTFQRDQIARCVIDN
ncbi:MAG: acyl-CoA/acyl-ACP dehydrogenase [Deltaproteobacteria bacterium]|nr:acyl-CoA/acyl-ACP dehydrogenase [Deltaproteobacteria bacterium]